jgi:hypothetical protein
MSLLPSGYDYTFVRVEDFDSAKKISIAKGCNKTVKTLYPPADKLTTPNMCVNRISRGNSSPARVFDFSHVGSEVTCLHIKYSGQAPRWRLNSDLAAKRRKNAAHSASCG